ncbi:hypothetical protein M8J75_011011 [Diaphorina citri]|nr:hypothetical protein M8J75_011011 [Diaphorina citri]
MHTPAIIESEDEWNDMAQRFKKEGIDYNNLKVEHKLLYVWRWLVDSEINLKNSRRMLDKLHEQQHEEIEEMENYVGKIRDQVQKQKEDLKDETDRLVEQVRSLRKLLADHDIQNDNLVDAVRIVLEERKRFSNELEILKSTKFGFYAMSTLDGGDSEPSQADEMLAEIIKVSSERELLKREVTEMNDRIEMLERSARQSELDNEKLAFKLSETLAELEDKEALLGEPQILCMRSHNNSNKSTLRRSETSKSLPLEMLDTDKCSTSKDRLDNTECTSSNPLNRDLSHSFGADSTPPSLLVSELQSFGSPRKLTSLLDSCNELARLEEMKRLQTECDSLRGHITVLGDKYNTLALRHIQYKAKRKFQLEDVQRQRLRAEEMFRKQVETDYRRLQEEKRAIASRLLNTEMDQREMQRELSILQKKISLLDNTNSELLARLLRLKYRDGLGVSSAGNSTAMGIPKSTTCDNVTSTWSNL